MDLKPPNLDQASFRLDNAAKPIQSIDEHLEPSLQPENKQKAEWNGRNFKNIVLKPFKKVEPEHIDLGTNVSNETVTTAMAANQIYTTSRRFIDIVHKAAHKTKDLRIVHHVKHIGVGLGAASIAFATLTIPFGIKRVYDAGRSLRDAIFNKDEKGKRDKDAIVDHTLDLAVEGGTFAGAAAGIGYGLQAAGVVAQSASWVPILGAVTSIFNGLAIVQSTKMAYQTHKLQKKIKVLQSGEKIDAAFAQTVKFIYDMKERDVEKFFGVEKSKMISHLAAINMRAIARDQQKIEPPAKMKKNQTENDIPKTEGEKIRQDTIKAMKRRLTTHKWSHIVSVGINVTTIVANITMFAAPVAAPGLFIAAGVMAIGRLVFDFTEAKGFDKRLKRLAENPAENKKELETNPVTKKKRFWQRAPKVPEVPIQTTPRASTSGAA